MERFMSIGGIYGQINLAVGGFMDRSMSSGGIYGKIYEQWRDLWID